MHDVVLHGMQSAEEKAAGQGGPDWQQP